MQMTAKEDVNVETGTRKMSTIIDDDRVDLAR
jgi:hypothetical protein